LGTATKGNQKRVVSGMRPTGRLHIGHYFGALQNWVRLQDDSDYDCYYFIADWHALTSDYAETSAVAQNTIEIVTDYLAAGLDPRRSVLFQQSAIPEHAELHLLLSMVTPLSWLERVPTYKEALENIKDRDLHTYGFLGYPCLQTADIVMYGEEGVPMFVPVGEDQVSHVELSREIVRRFNSYNGFGIAPLLFEVGHCQSLKAVLSHSLVEWAPEPYARDFVLEWFQICGKRVRGVTSGGNFFNVTVKTQIEAHIRRRVQGIGAENFLNEVGDLRRYFYVAETLTEPQVMLAKTPRVPGLDGRKMSKSYGNAITLSETDEDIRKKTKVMVTDPARKRRTDPGNPDVCPVYDWHKLFSPQETLDWSAEGCRTAGIGCIECKAAMADNLIKWIAPIRERRLEYEKHPAHVLEVMDAGSKRARGVAQETMVRVREAVLGWERKRKEISGGGTAANAS
jgi:tryptophanyl-tRNA synthetase